MSEITLSYADEFLKFREFGKNLLLYKPSNIDWQDKELSNEIGLKYLKTASIILEVLNCEQRYIPLKVIYDSKPLRNSYSNYYQVDSKKNPVIKLKILNFELTNGNGITKFNHIEVDSIFAKCLGDVKMAKFSESPFILKLQKEKYFDYTWSASNSRQGKPIFFDKLYSNNFEIASDSSYHFKGLVAPLKNILNKKDWYEVCDPTIIISNFEKEVIGRPLVCGITNELAKIDRFSLKRGDLIQITGNVLAGSASLFISRLDGGIVKITLLNRGNFTHEFSVPTDGDYSIFLSSNMSVYNYPYLDFKLSLKHLN